METGQGYSWMEDCQRIVEEFNEVAVPAFRQEYGADEDLLTIAMSLQPAQEDIQLDVGTRAAFLVESITGLVFKIGSNGRLREDKCIGHITGITGREVYGWLWW
jgi:hypothetical protein